MLTKRNVARAFARCWDPLFIMAPVTNVAKICLSKIWRVQKLLQQRKIQCKFDLKEKKNYRPLQNRRNQMLPTNLAEMQKGWPEINWDTDLSQLNLSKLPEEEQIDAKRLMKELTENWETFLSNLQDLAPRTIQRCNFSKIPFHISSNIKGKLIIVMSDATGGDKFGLLGAVAYLRVEYFNGQFSWQFLASSCKVAPNQTTIVVRELKALEIAIKLGLKVLKAVELTKKQIHFYVDNTIILDQISRWAEKKVASSRIVSNACTNILNEIDIGQLHFIFSQANSADYLSRPKLTKDLFQEGSYWFCPSSVFNQTGIPTFERMQYSKFTTKEVESQNILTFMEENLDTRLKTVNRLVPANVIDEVVHKDPDNDEIALPAITRQVKSKLKDNSTFSDEVDKIYELSDNIRIIVFKVHELIMNKSQNFNDKEEIGKDYEKLLQYVQNTGPCKCFYCNIKQQINLSENCLVTKDTNNVLPKLLSYKFEKEEIPEDVGLEAYFATFLLMLMIEQHRTYPKQVLLLASDESLPYKDILASASPFYNDNTKLLHMGGRIGYNGSGRRDLSFRKEHANHYKMILPINSKFTRLVLLNAHQRNQCAIAAFTNMMINERFYLPRALSQANKFFRYCSVCVPAKSNMKSMEPLPGNLKTFRLPHSIGDQRNRGYYTAFFDYKGPILVRDDREFRSKMKKNESREDQLIKIYILLVTCSLTRHTTLELVENRTYECTKMALLRIFYDRGAPRLLISDQEPAFKALARDFETKETKKEALDTINWLNGWNQSSEKSDLEQSYGVNFRFQNPESPELMGLAERLNRTITHSMLSLRQLDLKLSMVETVIKGLQCTLNKRALCIIDDEIITPNSLLTGHDINITPTYQLSKEHARLINSREDVVQHSKHMKQIQARIWSKFILSYVENLNLYKKKHAKSRQIVAGDYVLYSGINKKMSPINTYNICQVLDIIHGRNGDKEIRSLKVKLIHGGKEKIFTRNVRRFSLLELDGIKGELNINK